MQKTITKLPTVAGDWSTGKLFSRGMRTDSYLSEKREGNSSSSPFQSKISDPPTSTLCSAQNILLTLTDLTTWANHPFRPAPQQHARTIRRHHSPQRPTHAVNIHLCFIIIFLDNCMLQCIVLYLKHSPQNCKSN